MTKEAAAATATAEADVKAATTAVEVVKQRPSEVAMMGMFESMAGEGLENVTKDDILVPRLTILQALSPQLKKTKPEFIDGAKMGDICDVGLSEIFESPLHFLPVHFQKIWIEWAPRESDGGLVEIHYSADILDKCTENDRHQMVLPNGNYVAETQQFYGFNLSAGRRRCFISFASTQLKKGRKLNTLAMSEKVTRPDGTEYTPPMLYRTYMLGTSEEGNNKGDWVGWSINRGPRTQELGDGWENTAKEAIEFRAQIIAGEVKADQSDLAKEEAAGGAGGGGSADSDSKAM